MGSPINLDSIFRDRITYPNICDYTLTTTQVETWILFAREIRAFHNNPVLRPIEFVCTINLLGLTLPYPNANIFPDPLKLTAALEILTFPCLYIDFHSQTYDDQYLIASIDAVHKEDKFVVKIDRIQSDASGNPIWIHYKPEIGSQVMRFKRNDPVTLRIKGRNGDVIPFYTDSEDDLNFPANPMKQSLVSFNVISFVNDNRYSNKDVEPIPV